METLLALLGRFHPLAVHFPIALLVTASAVMLASRFYRRELAAAVPLLVHVGAASAVVACALGLAWASAESFRGEEAEAVSVHRAFTLVGTALAVIASVLHARDRAGRESMKMMLLLAATALVGAGAHTGGLMVFGDDHFTSAFETTTTSAPASEQLAAAAAEPVGEKAPPKQEEPKQEEPKKEEAPPPKAEEQQAKVDFQKEIWPILKKSCIKCHGTEKKKGDLRLDKKALAMKGGESGKVIVPGNGKGSKLYKLITLPEDDEDVMPAKGDLLTKEQQQLIKRWIDEGAHWPEK